ncbi:MAG: adenylate kinase [Candidatus Aenigmarchaeota archaeon]|nr:adenylate kinase [Candidatus Aenigmarchaeota archaeon]
MKLILTAVPGCGKTTIIKFVKKYATEKNIEISFANFGDYIFEAARAKGLIENRDEMRTKISKNEYEELQQMAADKIGQLKGNIIIDTHCSVKRKEGYYPGLPETIIKAIKPDVIVLIEKDPEFIAKLRMGDKTRTTRDVETAEEISTHQEINRSFAAAYAAMTKASVNIIEEYIPEEKLGKGEFGHAKDAAEKIIKLFEI